MVSQLALGEDVDQVPQEEQTETPEVAFEGAAAPPEEAATPEPEQPVTQAMVQEAIRQAAADAVRQDREAQQQQAMLAQRRRQAENAMRATDAQSASEVEERLSERMLLEANRLGLVDVDTSSMKAASQRVIRDVEPIHRRAALNEAARVVTHLAYQAAGAEPEFDLSPREEQMAASFASSVDSLIRNPRLREQIVAEERRNWEMNLKDEIAKGVEAELAKRQKSAKPVTRPANGAAPSTLDNSDSQRLLRIAGAGKEPGLAPPTPEDVAWYQSKYGQRRRPSWQQQ